jgi:hypothetical protein
MIELILATLATYRIALMMATEEGAFSVFYRIRERFDPEQYTWVGRGLNCPYCIGFWIAGLLALLIDRSLTYPVTWFGVAGGAMIVHKIIEK